tara:strand:- start:895 stop:1833 length:939 start_codon:yes stop_codon:yes gene_type:complete
MISVFYVITKYEINNELIIYWINGISKINFINVLIRISFLFFIFQIFLTSIIVPYTLDKGRSFFRTSNVDLFSSIIKEKKFIDTVENLTIFVENKNNNILNNILIKEKISDNQSQIIVAENGQITGDNQDSLNKQIILNNGKIINTENKKQNIINFTKFSLDLSKFNTKTITHPKVQEMGSLKLITCLKIINEFKKLNEPVKDKNFFIGCNLEILGPLTEEFLKRFFSPIFVILIGLSSSLIVMSSKDEKSYKFKNFITFCTGIIFIIISEISLRYSGLSLNNMVIYFLIPLIIFFTIYAYIFFHNRNYRRK